METKRCICLLLPLLLAGCAAPSAESGPPPGGAEPPPAAELYTIQLDSRTALVFDADGKEVPPEQRFTVLYDVPGNQPQCLVRSRTEITGERDANGEPVARHTSALYDLQGKMLCDFAPVDYEGGFGDFLIRHEPLGNAYDMDELPEDSFTELWNYRTGETAIPGVCYIESLDGEGDRLLLSGLRRALLGVCDREANILSGFPPPQAYHMAYARHGVVLARQMSRDAQGNDQSVLLTQGLEPILSCDYLNGGLGGLYGPHLYFEDGARRGILDPDGNERYLLPQGENIAYFDGELVILKNEDETAFRLVQIDGQPLAEGYEQMGWLAPDGDNGSSPARQFLGRRGETLELLERTGEATASRTLPGLLDFHAPRDGLILCTLKDSGETLLGEKLETLIEPGTYRWMLPIDWWRGGARQRYDLLECSYYLADGETMRRDVLALPSLKKIASGLTRIDGVGPDRLAVKRGFSAGLLDFEGNWIVKKSIFRSLNDDENEWSAYL